LTGCRSSSNKSAEKNVKANLTLNSLRNDFKYSNQTHFEVDTFSWETGPGKYKELDSTTFYMIWQDGKRKFVGKDYDRDYFFSWQERDTNFIELTIVTQNESDYCINLTYCIYDKKGKAVDQFIASSRCGDGGWQLVASGKFVDKHTYEKLTIESEMVDLDSLANEEYEGDSTLSHFIIGNNGKVKEKEIYKKHFLTKDDHD